MPRTLPIRCWAALLVSGCAASGASSDVARPATSVPPPPAGESAEVARRVEAVADEYFQGWLQNYPLWATFSGVPEAPNDRLGDNSLQATRAWERREDRWLAQLGYIGAGALRGSPDEATLGILRETLEAARQGRVCHRELWPLDQQGGWQIYLPVLSQLQPLGTASLRSQALARWRDIPRYIDNEIAALREGVRQGYTQPRGNAEAVRKQLDDLLATPPAKSPFAGIADRDSAPGFRHSVVAVVAGEILPAVRRYRDHLVSEYIPHARTSASVSTLPKGADCYQALVRTFTTVDRGARAVHQLGLEQMTAIETEMRPIVARSFGGVQLADLWERFRNDPKYTFQSREEIIRTAEQAVARAKTAMPKWFGRLPKADLIVDPCLPYEEESGCPNSYVPGTPDGSRPGRWRIHAGAEPAQPRAPLEGTAFHETYPGHHLQIAIAQERLEAHPVTRYFGFSGFSEGWALYAERIAMDMGLYSSDLYLLGELGGQALRAARLVVDPGLHVLGWSRQRAMDYLVAHTPESRTYIESEVDRYIASPGQATAYLTGRLEIESLRREAEARLGERFDIRKFHDKVLESGSVPLGLLRSHIRGWLDSNTKETSGS
ncbi:MAG: DUF885 domain-containing protein [Gemmatimonadales bacterium]